MVDDAQKMFNRRQRCPRLRWWWAKDGQFESGGGCDVGRGVLCGSSGRRRVEEMLSVVAFLMTVAVVGGGQHDDDNDDDEDGGDGNHTTIN